MTDCHQLHGRRRDICRGHDDHGRPIVMSPDRRRAYIARWIAAGQIDPAADGETEPHPDTRQWSHTPCRHLGGVVDTRICQLCGSRGVRYPVRTCGTHGECSEIKRAGPLRDCRFCPDYTPGDQPVTHPITPHCTRFAVGITTAPRPQPTLARCTESVIRAGFNDPVIFAEPGTELGLITQLAGRIVRRPETVGPVRFTAESDQWDGSGRFGAWRNWIQSLRDLLTLQPDAQAIVLIQDDVVFTRDVRAFLEHDLWPSDRTGIVSLYSPNLDGYEGDTHIGCRPRGGQFLVGACALVMPRNAAQRLVDHPFARNWRGSAKGEQPIAEKKKAIDTYIGHAMSQLNLRSYFYNPSMAQHFAPVSSLGHGGARGKRRSGRFPGEGGSAFGSYKDHPPWVRYNLPSGNQRYAGQPALSIDPVNVIIPAVDQLDLTLRCLDHLAAHAGIPVEVLYVDNGSRPGTIESIEQHAARLDLPLRVIANDTNRGFTIAVNQGLAASAGRHVLLLNNDCFLGPGCLPSLKRHLEWHPKVAATGPLTGDRGHQSLRKAHRRRSAGIHTLPDLTDPVASAAACQRQHVTAEKMLTGFCCLKHRDALQQLGPLDENPEYPGGLGTDDEWSRRARAGGWQLLLCHDAYAAHLHKQTFQALGLDRRGMSRRAYRQLRKTA